MHFIGTIPKLTGKRDDFRNHQLGNAPRVAERGIKHSNAMFGSILKIDLVSANAEATDDYEVSCFLQHSSRKFRLRTNTNDMYVTSNEFIISER